MKIPMSDKTPEMREAIESLFPGTKKAIEEKRCPSCANPIGPFKNFKSTREYEISGLCQKCQDEIWG